MGKNNSTMMKKVKQIFFMTWLFLTSFMAVPNIFGSLTRPLGQSVPCLEGVVCLQDVPVNSVEDFISRILGIGLSLFLIAIPSYAIDTSNPGKSFWAIKIPSQKNQLIPIFCGAGLALLGIFTRL